VYIFNKFSQTYGTDTKSDNYLGTERATNFATYICMDVWIISIHNSSNNIQYWTNPVRDAYLAEGRAEGSGGSMRANWRNTPGNT
jgi:hypothetical protein